MARGRRSKKSSDAEEGDEIDSTENFITRGNSGKGSKKSSNTLKETEDEIDSNGEEAMLQEDEEDTVSCEVTTEDDIRKQKLPMVVRATVEDQQKTDRYVPGRLRRIQKTINNEADHYPDGSRSKNAICNRCGVKVPFSSNSASLNEALFHHVGECWGPGPEPPNKQLLSGEVKPNYSGQISLEKDVDCLVFCIFSPGPYRGAYQLTLALPAETGTVQSLDRLVNFTVHFLSCYNLYIKMFVQVQI